MLRTRQRQPLQQPSEDSIVHRVPECIRFITIDTGDCQILDRSERFLPLKGLLEVPRLIVRCLLRPNSLDRDCGELTGVVLRLLKNNPHMDRISEQSADRLLDGPRNVSEFGERYRARHRG